jgi:hypothetical protein
VLQGQHDRERDPLMRLILRAMVRGRPESFVHDRTVRGPDPAQRFLAELKQIQQGLIARTPRGRIAMPSAWEHIGLAVPGPTGAPPALFD